MWATVYQNCLTLDYLFASEGGICEKFNLSDCCLQTGHERKVIEEIIYLMRKTANIPTQTWKGGTLGNYLGDGFQLSEDSKLP